VSGPGAGHDPGAALAAAFAEPPARLGVAVSGGSDSTALLIHLANWAAAAGRPDLHVVTVDHGLRPEAAAEAAAVARLAGRLGLDHDVLHWRWDGQGNLQDAARRGRYRAIAGWAAAHGIADVALGHTADDQAETVLMRLARGSGVDGLAAMRPVRQALGITWHRPFLGLGRAALRADLEARGIGWSDDPSNEDPGYDRIRARRALAALAPLGIEVSGLTETAARMARAAEALAVTAADAARRIAAVDAGDVVFDAAGLAALPRDIRERLVAAALVWVASADYRPRYAALLGALRTARAGRAATLHGCLLLPGRGTLRIAREPRAVQGLRGPATTGWDGRWQAAGPDLEGLEIAALGEAGLAACPDWRATGRPRAALLAAPALWRGDTPVACPAAGLPSAWRFEPAPDLAGFLAAVTSH